MNKKTDARIIDIDGELGKILILDQSKILVDTAREHGSVRMTYQGISVESNKDIGLGNNRSECYKLLAEAIFRDHGHIQ